MILICFLMISQISRINATDIFVDVNSQESFENGSDDYPFHTIQNAVNAISYLVIPDSIATFQILPGTYVSTHVVVQIDLLTNAYIKKWIFRAYDGEVSILDSMGVNGIMEFKDMMGCDVYIENLKFQSSYSTSKGIFVTSPCLIGTLKVSGCSFGNLDMGIYVTEGYNDDSITIVDSLLVQNCSFDGIRSGGYGILTSAAKSGSYTVENKFITNIIIKDNEFNTEMIVNPFAGYNFDSIKIRNWRKNSPAYDSVAVFNNQFLNQRPNVMPSALSIESLNAFHSSHECDRALKVWVFDNKIENSRIHSSYSKLKFYNNKAAFLNDPVSYFLSFTSFAGYRDTLWAERNYIKSFNNYILNNAVLIDNHNTNVGVESQGTTFFMHASNSNVYLMNSIMHDYSDFFFIAGSLVTAQYCFIDDIVNNPLIFYYQDTMVIGDPLIQYDDNNLTYELKWDSAQKSPCIDAGHPELTNVLYDRPDIGAKEFDSFEHVSYTYTFPPRSVNHGIKWMSFPVLRNASNEPFANTIEAVDFFTHDNILYPDILEQIEWNDIYDEENQNQRIEYNQNWSNLNHVVTSPQGYKVQMDALNDVERRIAVSGFLQDLNTDIQLYGLHNGQYKENWLGYYYPKSQHVFDALNGFLDELWFIQTQHWTLIRQYSQLGGPWVGVLTPASKPLVLSPGDMVVVKCFRDCDFTWGDFGPQWQPQPPLKPEHFEYLEKLEYIPIMTDFRNSNLELPKEIAVYVNGICKGAAVVTDSLAQILAYICDDLPDDPELEFMLYYDSKSPVTMPAYEYWDSRTDTFRSDGLSLKDRQDYYLVQMKSNAAGETPLPRLYLTARPNPFNPSTRISYYLSKDSRVTLGIYNVKGQLVKTLIQESKTAGMQSAEWDGRDENGKPCAGGVYYCRLSAGGKRVSRKLTLLK